MGSLPGWEVPGDLVERWIGLHGRSMVIEWMADAQARAVSCADRWDLAVDAFLPGGSLSCVLACRRSDGSDAVLKLIAPWAGGAAVAEARALAAWGGRGVVGLLEHTLDGRCLLLRRARPGQSFSPSGNDAADCALVAQTFAALASAPIGDLPALGVALDGRFERARAMARARGSFVSNEVLRSAERRAQALALSGPARVAVHGDAQNKNLLVDGVANEVVLVAIDPEPSLGDRHFDPALWALTHRPGVAVRERCAMLAELLDLDAERLWAWCEVLAPVEVALDVPARARAHRELLVRAGAWGG